MLDGTPVLDIKPYLPYSDSLPHAQSGYAAGPPPAKMEVAFTREAARTCRLLEDRSYPRLQRLILDLLSLDPRPGYADTVSKHEFGMHLWDLNIKFKVADDQMIVESIEPDGR
jgi:hypothetical protein